MATAGGHREGSPLTGIAKLDMLAATPEAAVAARVDLGDKSDVGEPQFVPRSTSPKELQGKQASCLFETEGQCCSCSLSSCLVALRGLHVSHGRTSGLGMQCHVRAFSQVRRIGRMVCAQGNAVYLSMQLSDTLTVDAQARTMGTC